MNRTPEERASHYLDEIPGAIEGQGGDLHTYEVACCLVNDFALSETQAWPLFEQWNRKCVPPWNERELRTKLKNALRYARKPKGNKLEHEPEQRPVADGFTPGSRDQLQRLAALRGIGREGLEWAQERGLLVFGLWHDQECYGVTDSSKKVCELRRLDGANFPAFGELSERKSHALKGSVKSWPVGILEAEPFPCIALLEGMPDFLAAHYVSLREDVVFGVVARLACAPVAMLSASPEIASDALPHFKGKKVRIYPHADDAGIKGATKWHRQLQNAGVTCDFFDLTKLRAITNGRVKDLNDFVRIVDPSLCLRFPQLLKIMPGVNYGRN